MDSKKKTLTSSISSKIFFIPKLVLRLVYWPINYLFFKSKPKTQNTQIAGNEEDQKINYQDYFQSDAPLQQKFKKACDLLKSCASLSNDQQLMFYGLFKQAKEGDCNKPKPNLFDIVEGKKWEAWKSKGGIKCDEAMALYIKTFEEIVLPFSKEDEEKDIFLNENEMENQNKEKRGFGVKMSRIIQNDENSVDFKIENTQKPEMIDQFFKLVIEENVEEIKKMITEGYALENKNSSGVNALHFSIDNEKINSFLTLLPHYASLNINIPDSTGMTPLHYALCIDNAEILEALLQKNPDPFVKDLNGEDAMSLANSKQKESINKYFKKQ